MSTSTWDFIRNTGPRKHITPRAITEGTAREIKLKLKEGVPRKEICKLFGVKAHIVADIAAGKTWKWA